MSPLMSTHWLILPPMACRCLCKLMASKTRVVVTSKLEHLKRADRILLLHNGTCYFYGTFSELQAHRPNFSGLLLGLEAYDSINAERRCSVLTETLRRISVDETSGPQPESFRQTALAPEGGGPDRRKLSVPLSPLAASRKFSLIQPEEEGGHERMDRRFSVVPEDNQVEEVLPRGNVYHHGLKFPRQRRQSVLAFITNAQDQGRREQLQSSFRKKLSVTPQCELASELDIYTRRLSKDSMYNITEDVDEENMEVGCRSAQHCRYSQKQSHLHSQEASVGKNNVTLLGIAAGLGCCVVQPPPP